MSRKWSPNAEVARDRLFDQLQFSGLGAAERWQLVDDFAHALAQQIRDYAAVEVGAENEEIYGYAADLIDPASSEETTT